MLDEVMKIALSIDHMWSILWICRSRHERPFYLKEGGFSHFSSSSSTFRALLSADSMDVICVVNTVTGELHCTEFYVKFKSTLIDEGTAAILGLNTDGTSPISNEAFRKQ